MDVLSGFIALLKNIYIAYFSTGFGFSTVIVIELVERGLHVRVTKIIRLLNLLGYKTHIYYIYIYNAIVCHILNK